MSQPARARRLDLEPLRQELNKRAGKRAGLYWESLRRFLYTKLSKKELDKNVQNILGEENVKYHNLFIRAILTNTILSSPPPSLGKGDKKKKPVKGDTKALEDKKKKRKKGSAEDERVWKLHKPAHEGFDDERIPTFPNGKLIPVDKRVDLEFVRTPSSHMSSNFLRRALIEQMPALVGVWSPNVNRLLRSGMGVGEFLTLRGRMGLVASEDVLEGVDDDAVIVMRRAVETFLRRVLRASIREARLDPFSVRTADVPPPSAAPPLSLSTAAGASTTSATSSTNSGVPLSLTATPGVKPHPSSVPHPLGRYRVGTVPQMGTAMGMVGSGQAGVSYAGTPYTSHPHTAQGSAFGTNRVGQPVGTATTSSMSYVGTMPSPTGSGPTAGGPNPSGSPMLPHAHPHLHAHTHAHSSQQHQHQHALVHQHSHSQGRIPAASASAGAAAPGTMMRGTVPNGTLAGQPQYATSPMSSPPPTQPSQYPQGVRYAGTVPPTTVSATQPQQPNTPSAYQQQTQGTAVVGQAAPGANIGASANQPPATANQRPLSALPSPTTPNASTPQRLPVATGRPPPSYDWYGAESAELAISGGCCEPSGPCWKLIGPIELNNNPPRSSAAGQ
eukprot:Rmarinus@m.10557